MRRSGVVLGFGLGVMLSALLVLALPVAAKVPGWTLLRGDLRVPLAVIMGGQRYTMTLRLASQVVLQEGQVLSASVKGFVLSPAVLLFPTLTGGNTATATLTTVDALPAPVPGLTAAEQAFVEQVGQIYHLYAQLLAQSEMQLAATRASVGLRDERTWLLALQGNAPLLRQFTQQVLAVPMPPSARFAEATEELRQFAEGVDRTMAALLTMKPRQIRLGDALATQATFTEAMGHLYQYWQWVIALEAGVVE